MSISKERRDHLRDRTAHNVNGPNCVPINRDELRALLDLADERDRYRALLAGYVGALDELARVHDALGYPTESASCRGKAHHVEAALEGKE